MKTKNKYKATRWCTDKEGGMGYNNNDNNDNFISPKGIGNMNRQIIVYDAHQKSISDRT